MPYRFFGKGKLKARRRRVGGQAAARSRLMYRKKRMNPVPTFTETYTIPVINTGTTGTAAGLLATAMDQIPQWTDYQALYNQYCIRSAQFIIMPEYDQYDSNNSATATTAAVTAPRLVYAINDSAQQVAPTSEVQVLQDNGAKIRTLDRPIKIRCRPVAQVATTDSNGNPQFETRRSRWLSFQNAGTAHSGVAWALTQTIPNSVLGLPAMKVYVKVTFSLRDPK